MMTSGSIKLGGAVATATISAISDALPTGRKLPPTQATSVERQIVSGVISRISVSDAASLRGRRQPDFGLLS
jgi:hypothetical protein